VGKRRSPPTPVFHLPIHPRHLFAGGSCLFLQPDGPLRLHLAAELVELRDNAPVRKLLRFGAIGLSLPSLIWGTAEASCVNPSRTYPPRMSVTCGAEPL
jgi:hypothetical protein